MKKSLIIGLLFLALAAGQAYAVTTGVYDTRYGQMTINQDGSSLWGNYGSSGEITGTLDGTVFKGWWREGSTGHCGPSGAWAGPLLIVFSTDGKTFVNSDFGNCPHTPDELNTTLTSWPGHYVSGTPVNTGVASFPADCVATLQVTPDQKVYVHVPCLQLGNTKLWVDFYYLNTGLDFSIQNYGLY